MDRIEATVSARAEQLRAMLNAVDVRVYDEGVDRCGIVTCASAAVDAGELQAVLAGQGINSTYTHTDSSRWDVERRALPPLLRLSIHYTTTVDELDVAVAAIVDRVRGR